MRAGNDGSGGTFPRWRLKKSINCHTPSWKCITTTGIPCAYQLKLKLTIPTNSSSSTRFFPGIPGQRLTRSSEPITSTSNTTIWYWHSSTICCTGRSTCARSTTRNTAGRFWRTGISTIVIIVVVWRANGCHFPWMVRSFLQQQENYTEYTVLSVAREEGRGILLIWYDADDRHIF